LPGFDLLISRYLSREIKSQLEPDILKKIERELFFENGMSIKLSIGHFKTFHNVLKNFSNMDIKKFENDCIKKIIQISKSKSGINIKIIDPNLAVTIFDFYGDSETRKILQCIMGKSKTVSEILETSGVLKSPGYRKIENLLLNGLILESGKIITKQKRISQYCCLFDNVSVLIKKDDLVIEGVINPYFFKASSITKIGLFD
jgi:hypothetical protein